MSDDACAGCDHEASDHNPEYGCLNGWKWDEEGCATVEGCTCPWTIAEGRRYSLLEQGRRLASRRDDLIAEGVDPSDLEVPLAPPNRPEETP